MATFPGIWHPLVESNVNGPETGLGQDRSRLIGDSSGLHHDPNEVVRNQHQRMHQSGHVESLEGPDISRSHHDHRPRALDAELAPLLSLDRVDDLVRLHHLNRIRVRPRPDSDPVPADHHAAAGARRDGRRSPVQLELNSQRRGAVVEVQGPDSAAAKLSGGAERRRVEVGGGSGEEEEEYQAREAESEDETDEAAESM